MDGVAMNLAVSMITKRNLDRKYKINTHENVYANIWCKTAGILIFRVISIDQCSLLFNELSLDNKYGFNNKCTTVWCGGV